MVTIVINSPFVFDSVKIEATVSCMLGKCSATELQSQAQLSFLTKPGDDISNVGSAILLNH